MTRDLLAELPVLAELPAEEQTRRLAELGDEGAGVEQYGVFSRLFGARAWQHTAHVHGHIPAAGLDAGDRVPIRSVHRVQVDSALRGVPLVLSLDRLHVADYPGRGEHRILFTFQANHQPRHDDAGAEEVRFNATCHARSGAPAPVLGLPVFVGLRAGARGLTLGCHTINVASSGDERFLAFLDSAPARAGLHLAAVAQPAVGVVSEAALGLGRALLVGSRNVGVQRFTLHLDTAFRATGAGLAEGAYVAAQVPPEAAQRWDWSQWTYDVDGGRIVGADGEALPVNHVVLGVRRLD